MPDYDAPLPKPVLRDLLALCRALYATFIELGPKYDDQRFELRRIGAQLATALEKAERGGPGTLANRAAWLISESALRDLGKLIDVYLLARTVLDAATKRVMSKA